VCDEAARAQAIERIDDGSDRRSRCQTDGAALEPPEPVVGLAHRARALPVAQ
jgi:hypothetical protein